MSPSAGGTDDRVLRSITDDGSFRMIAARIDRTARGAIAAQQVEWPVSGLFAELLTSAVLYRETMAPQLRVQCVLQGPPGGARLVADAQPDGATRGLVSLADGQQAVTLDSSWRLVMSRALPGARLHEGVVEVPDNGDLSAALMVYYQESEQVVSAVAVAAVESPDGVRCGGFVVQILPEVTRTPLALITDRLAALPDLTRLLAEDASVHTITGAVLADLPHTLLDESQVRFHCPCSRARAAGALASAGRSEVELACAEGRELVTTCEFCHRVYAFAAADLARLLSGETEH